MATLRERLGANFNFLTPHIGDVELLFAKNGFPTYCKTYALPPIFFLRQLPKKKNPVQFKDRIFSKGKNISLFIGDDSSPDVIGAPDALAGTFQLHELAVIDKEIHLRTVIFDIPLENLRIGGFKHYIF